VLKGATATDVDAGMMDKFLSSPIRRTSILLGRVTADAITMSLRGDSGGTPIEDDSDRKTGRASGASSL